MTRVRVQRVGLGLLGLCAGYQLLMGVYFVLLRPPLLPEDERAIGMTLGEAERNLPGLTVWLDRVFTVLGGQAIAVGLLAGFVVWIIARVRFSKLALSVLAGSAFSRSSL